MPNCRQSTVATAAAPRLLLAVLLPVLACGLQWLLWDAWIKPYVWFLFFPAAFFSAWLGGLRGGLAGTLVGAGLVWFVFIPPAYSFALNDWSAAFSIVVFVVMGGLFAWFFERLTQAMRRSDEALHETELANARITELYRKTLELDTLKSQFFANLSHELRTPLTLLLAPLEVRLQRPAGAVTPAEERRETEMMLRNARLLYRHVSDLLDAAKLEAGRMTVNWAKVDLASLLRTAASHFESLAQERGISFVVTAPDRLPAEADAAMLQRVLLNLLSNAFKFTPDAGAIALELRANDGQAVITLQDSGPGIPFEMRAAVFERFRQVEGNSRRRFGGTGLGLAIVKDFVELHGGRVTVDAAPAGGALFIVQLPLLAPAGSTLGEPTLLDPQLDRQGIEELAGQRRPAAAEAAGSPAEAPLVLVVEDNPDMNAYLAATLRPRYRVACAFDGIQGIAMTLALRPDLVISDLMMPRGSGDELVADLRRRPECADLPIVMLSARADEAERVRLLRQGVQDYLAKPFAAEELLARVGGLLAGRRRARDQLRRYEEVVATSGDALAFIDTDRRYLLANPAYAGIVGKSPESLQRQAVAAVVGAATWAVIEPKLDRAFAGEVQRFVAEVLLADGRRRVLDAEYRPFQRDGRIEGVVVSLRDISELMQGEVSLRRQAAELRARNDELERFDTAAMARELQMIELKREVNALAGELGRARPYDLAFADAGANADAGAPT